MVTGFVVDRPHRPIDDAFCLKLVCTLDFIDRSKAVDASNGQNEDVGDADVAVLSEP